MHSIKSLLLLPFPLLTQANMLQHFVSVLMQVSTFKTEYYSLAQ